jgi:hypothetical protein
LFTTQTPSILNATDGVGINYELGTRFTSVTNGIISAIRFYKTSKETGTHTGRIWNSSGTQVASVVFTNETASGWQQQALTTPLSITANAIYTVSVNTGNTYYAATNNGFASQISSGSLRSVVGGNGRYGSAGKFPTNTFQSSNYFRDIVFTATTGTTPPPAPTPTPVPPPAPTPVPPPTGGASMILNAYDGPAMPTNKAGETYPSFYGGLGSGTFSINSLDAISGKSLLAHLTSGMPQIQFNPYSSNSRGFARDYSVNPSGWLFNTYNRMSFWIKTAAEPSLYLKDGRPANDVGAYAKTVANPDGSSDEAGGGHFYYNMNWPRTGTWVHVILNTFVDHWRGNSGGTEEPPAAHITGEPNYNLFDALTRFYIEDESGITSLPRNYQIDEISFYREPNAEAEEAVRDISATFVPQTNQVILTWFRNKDENSVKQEVRYAFSDIHQLGWNNATVAPNGTVTPPGFQGYNGMFYDTTGLPLAGHSVVYVAIKPQNSSLFTQVAIPLNGGPSPIPSLPTTGGIGPMNDSTWYIIFGGAILIIVVWLSLEKKKHAK